MEDIVGAKVCNGEIIVLGGHKEEENITIKARKHVKLFINNELCEIYKPYMVNSTDKITYECEKLESSREVKINISKDKMEAYISVIYIPAVEYKLKDRELFMNLAISAEISKEEQPEHFTVSELREILKKNGVVYGINEVTLENICNGTLEPVLIAKGDQPIKDKPRELKLLFTPSQMILPEEESIEKIDYKNLFRISNVNAGDKIGEIIPQVLGKDGMNVLGKVIKREYVRDLPISCSGGCKIENNDVIALIDGKAHSVNKTIGVNPVYTVDSVNMETCNIKFYGDIEVYNSVDDNMSVNAGGSLDVSENVNTSDVVTGGNINIIGNAINSKILTGQIDVVKKEYSDILNKYREIIAKIIEIIETRYSNNTNNIGQLILMLTENKFKDFQQLSLNIISLNIKNNTKNSRIVDFIKEKILGYNILNLKSFNELHSLLEILENEIDFYDKHTIVPLDVRIGYCQDCEIKSTGNIIISGKGEYISNLNAMKDILFTKSNSIARGGTLTAGGNISAGIVGSPAYIATILKVPLDGKISATLAYKNTILCFGNNTKILDYDYKNINARYNRVEREIEIINSALS